MSKRFIEFAVIRVNRRHHPPMETSFALVIIKLVITHCIRHVKIEILKSAFWVILLQRLKETQVPLIYPILHDKVEI